MTRWARVGSTQKHQKPPGEATSWEELSKNAKGKSDKMNKIRKGRIGKKDRPKKKNPETGKNFGCQSPASNTTEIPEHSKTKVVLEENKAENLNMPKVLTKNQKKRRSKWKKQQAIAAGTYVPRPEKINKQDEIAGSNIIKTNGVSNKAKHDESTKDNKKKEKRERLTKKQQKFAKKKKKLEILKTSQVQDSVSENSTDKGSLPPVDKDFLSRKQAYLEKLKRKKNSDLILPSKIQRKLFHLKKSLREKGMSQAGIKEIINKERGREEEKFKKIVFTKPCFNCRQTGHLLVNCPQKIDPSKSEAGSCYKCGSSDHTSSKCKKKIAGYPLAKCFVCKEQGHISRDCPKNKHGLYIKGGKCSFCGNVNHLLKDCPSRKSKKEKESISFTLNTISEGKSVDEEILEAKPFKPKKKINKPKVVKF